MVIFGALLLVGVSVFLLLHPILSGREAPLWSAGDEPSEAEFRKRVSLLQLRDAEYEYAMGKLGEEDYLALRKQLSAEALKAIRSEETAGPEGSDVAVGAAEEELEAEIARIRERLTGGVFCSQCGHPNPGGSRFCAECGSPLASPKGVGAA